MADGPNRPRAAGADVRIQPGDRVAIFGRSGSGKSYLLRELVVPYRRVLFLDPKRRNDFGGWAILEGARAVERAWPRQVERVIARPALLENEREWMDRLCRLAYYVGHCALAADELPDGVTADRTVPWLDVCLKRGREVPLTTIVATQRPLDVPKPIRTEAEHIFAFDLNDPDDRRYLGKLIGDYWTPRTEHGFLYWTPLTRAGECAPI